MKETFTRKPTMAYHRNRNLGDILGQKTLINSKVIRRNRSHKIGSCSPCSSRNENKCCRQIRRTTRFKSYRTNKSYNIFHRVNCKSKLIIYLMECLICKLQYVGKSEWPMNIRINKHRNDVFRIDGLDVCKHFQKTGHNFDKHAKFTIIEELKDKNKHSLPCRNCLNNEKMPG